MRQALPWLLGSALLGSAGLAQAGLFEDDEARRAILELRQSQAELRSQMDATRKQSEQWQADSAHRQADDSAALRKALLELQNQLEALGADVAKLRGQNEVLARELAEVQRRQKDDLVGLDERLRRIEPLKVSIDGREFLAEPGEKRDYEQAFAVFRKGEFDRAQVALVDFLNRYGPNSGYRVPALFWLGNAQYALKDYKEAIANFRSLIAAAPDHLRVPESMLAISNCQWEMKDTKAARKTLEELVKAFPSSEAGVAAKERLGRMK
ncbi:tol-pal system protein YbgF [Curvibacter sp. APW13]|uniref:tol-pal system protein YbgF n=1 Tax=Curvibacter sp. APW13 TaxID=3077236 RepID=UPI0028DD8BDF|nr:tol-pal system protein YbgF [Curvibacter sp. APW13]MDT8991575.1 tol-pal system protein YbgF [Curvibacter sp. APW13]